MPWDTWCQTISYCLGSMDMDTNSDTDTNTGCSICEKNENTEESINISIYFSITNITTLLNIQNEDNDNVWVSLHSFTKDTSRHQPYIFLSPGPLLEK